MNEQHITHEKGNPEAWVCVCGNTPSDSGFFPIDSGNREVEPTKESWTTNQYYCGRCGAVIDQSSLEIVRQLDPHKVKRLA